MVRTPFRPGGIVVGNVVKLKAENVINVDALDRLKALWSSLRPASRVGM